MSHTHNLVRGLVTAAAGLALTVPFAAAPAQAGTVDRSWNVDATTTIKSVDQTIAIPTGSLNAKVDFATGKLTGNLALPNATQRLSYSTIPLADVTVAFHQAAPVTGTFNVNAGTAKATAKFNVQVVSIRPVAVPWLNLISGSCTTKAPGVANIAGPLNMGGASTLTGTYQLPAFTNCGGKLVDLAISAGLSGKGNTMTATLSN